jgi:hypothetical protein
MQRLFVIDRRQRCITPVSQSPSTSGPSFHDHVSAPPASGESPLQFAADTGRGGLCERELAPRHAVCGNGSASKLGRHVAWTCCREARGPVVSCPMRHGAAPVTPISRSCARGHKRKRGHQRAWRTPRRPADAAAPRAVAVDRAALRLAARHAVDIRPAALLKTTSCPKVVRRVRAWRHMDHSPTVGQVSKATVSRAAPGKTQGSRTPTSKAPTSRGLGSGLERRGGWTFTLGTCRTDFPRFASLPRSACTGTSVRGSLGSCQGELRPWHVFFFCARAAQPTRFSFSARAPQPTRFSFSARAPQPTRSSFPRGRRNPGDSLARGRRKPGDCLSCRHAAWRAGAAIRACFASFQVQSRVLVPKLGRASYIGAGEAKQTLDGGCFEGAARRSPYPRCRQRPFTATVRVRHERHEPMSPPREELGARWI